MPQSNASIQGIIFDLGRVLVDFDHGIAARKLSGVMHKTPQEVYDLFFSSGLTQLFEAGKLSPEEFFLKIKEALGLCMEYDDFLPVWNGIFFLSDENKALYGLVKGLRKRYKVLLLSNINVLHYNYLKEHFPVFDVFHAVVTSFETGVIKPDPRIYRKALEVLAMPAQTVFYTDDRPELIEGALSLGIKGFVYRGVEQLKIDLSSCGIHA
ncbi:MAG: HAD family phosphatase [Candidatus Omnitrophota bacterium]|jgi:putative hydrolase of the HAD superfamily